MCLSGPSDLRLRWRRRHLSAPLGRSRRRHPLRRQHPLRPQIRSRRRHLSAPLGRSRRRHRSRFAVSTRYARRSGRAVGTCRPRWAGRAVGTRSAVSTRCACSAVSSGAGGSGRAGSARRARRPACAGRTRRTLRARGAGRPGSSGRALGAGRTRRPGHVPLLEGFARLAVGLRVEVLRDADGLGRLVDARVDRGHSCAADAGHPDDQGSRHRHGEHPPHSDWDPRCSGHRSRPLGLIDPGLGRAPRPMLFAAFYPTETTRS